MFFNFTFFIIYVLFYLPYVLFPHISDKTDIL